MNIIPISFKEAKHFVNNHHRHHSSSIGCKFCLGLENDGKLKEGSMIDINDLNIGEDDVANVDFADWLMFQRTLRERDEAFERWLDEEKVKRNAESVVISAGLFTFTIIVLSVVAYLAK